MSLRTLRRLPLLLLLLCLALPAFAAPDLYVSSVPGADVQRFNGSTGAPVSAFQVDNQPSGVAFGPDGALYAASYGAGDVLRYDPAAGTTTVFVAPGAGGLGSPLGIAFGPDGSLYVVSNANNSVLRYDGKTGASLGAFVPSGSGGLAYPVGLAFGPDGSLYVDSSTGAGSVLRYNGKTGAFVDTFVPSGSGSLVYPSDLAFSPGGDLYVVSHGSSAGNGIVRYDGKTGAFVDTFVPIGSGGLAYPFGIAFGPDGALYVTSYDGNGANDVLRYDGTTGAFLNVFATLPTQPDFLAFGPTSQAAPLSLSVSPASVPGGSPAALTVTLAQPAPASSPVPAQPGQTAAGGFVRLSSSTPGVTFGAGPTADGGTVFQGNDGAFYVFLPAGSSVATVPLATTVVTKAAAVTLTGQYAGGTSKAILTLLGNAVASFTVSPATVYNGVSSAATLTLNYPAVSGPDPSSPGQTASGAVVLLGSDSPAAQFGTGPIYDSSSNFLGSVYLASNGSVYAFIPYGKTSLTFPVSTSFVPARTVAHLSATLNGAARTAALTITPTFVASFTVSPATVYNGVSSTATLTLNGPAVPGPGQSGYGAVILLGSDTAAAQFQTGVFLDSSNNFLGSVYQNGGAFYAFIPNGKASLTFTVNTSFVPAQTVARLSATLNGAARTAKLTITPTLVASFTLSPATVYNGVSGTATLTLNGPAVSGPDPSSPGQTAYGAFILLGSDTPGTQATPGPIYDSSQNFIGSVYLAPNGSLYAFIPQGRTSLTFPVGTSFVPARTVTHLTATLNGTVRTATLTVTPTLVQSLTLSPASVYNGQGSTATLTLNSPAIIGPDPSSPGQTAGGAVVLLGSDSPAAQFGTGPIYDSSSNFLGAVYQASNGSFYALIAQGKTALTFTINTSSVPARTAAHLSATLSGGTQTAALTVRPTQIAAFTLNPVSVLNGRASAATLTLNGPAVIGPDPSNPGQIGYGAVVLLGSDSPAAQFGTGPIYDSSSNFLGSVYLASNGSVYAFILFGKTSLTFPVNTTAVLAPTTAYLSAALNGASQAVALTVRPAALSGLSLLPPSVFGGVALSGTVSLAQAAPVDTLVILSSTSGAASPPTGVTIYAGQTTATFTVPTAAVAADVTGSLTATDGGAALSAIFHVRGNTLAGLVLSASSTVGGSGPLTGTVILAQPAAADTLVALSSSNPSAAAPAAPAVTVPAGATSATFTVTTSAVSSATVVALTATLNGTSRTAFLTVQSAP